ncbi:MAG: hypothetical protein AAF387_10560 [Pseudomonadota bacterium]
MQRLKTIAPLRLALFALVCVLVTAALFADGQTHMHDWRLFPNVIAPSLAMMVFFVLPLDITMSAVFLSSSDDQATREQLMFVIKLDCFFFFLLVCAWIPFMLKILDISLF